MGAVQSSVQQSEKRSQLALLGVILISRPAARTQPDERFTHKRQESEYCRTHFNRKLTTSSSLVLSYIQTLFFLIKRINKPCIEPNKDKFHQKEKTDLSALNSFLYICHIKSQFFHGGKLINKLGTHTHQETKKRKKKQEKRIFNTYTFFCGVSPFLQLDK